MARKKEHKGTGSLQVSGMRGRWGAIVILALAWLLLAWRIPSFAQNKDTPKSLTLLFTNNINAEIDPCPS